MQALQLWGGIECTVNRVHDRFHNQLASSGHDRRSSDLDAIAALGLRTLRYPVLWELTAPHGLAAADWSFADARLARLAQLGIEPIVGLAHHGSGPRHTHLLDDAFATGLAEFAGAVAQRFPWLECYTPVNEPLTTARFSALYGHWYPHARDDRSFLRALLNQCRAVVLAMRAIRRVNRAAALVQTDDLGTTYCRPTLAYQAEFENARRWLSWDLLCGKVDRAHALWPYFMRTGIDPGAVLWFSDNPCVPAIVGINHYLTSDRFLDDRCELYDPACVGGNGRDRYADVEAVRVLPELDDLPPGAGVSRLLVDAWQRYGVPVALTEAHLGCTREEQMRWLHDIWAGAVRARRCGADVRAVTAWALLGSFDWNSLVTRDDGYYEPGAFDVRGRELRPTAVADLLAALARGARPTLPAAAKARRALLHQPGWWRRPERLHGRVRAAGAAVSAARAPRSRARPLLIAGGNGTLGRAFERLCAERGLAVVSCNRGRLDIAAADGVVRTLAEARPWAVINAAGYVRVDDAERDCERCYRENVHGAEVLATACAERGIPLLTFSSDLVFDGASGAPYVESSSVAPLCVYGISKARAESAVLARCRDALIVRTSAFFGPWDEYNFPTLALRALASGRPFAAAHDWVVSPTYVPDLVHASLDLLLDRATGIWHLANAGEVSWYDFALAVARAAGVDARGLQRVRGADLALPAPRPRFSALASERGRVMPALESALARFVAVYGRRAAQLP